MTAVGTRMLAPWMARRAWSLVLVAALVLIAACGSSSPSADRIPRPSSEPLRSLGASPTPPAEPSVPPIATGPAWAAIEARIDTAGQVSADTALQAFALAIGDLPGVTPPDGNPGTMRSGTMALRWLLGYWDRITPEQQAAVVEVLPDLAGLPRTASRRGTAVLVGARHSPPPVDRTRWAFVRSNAVYTAMANELAAEIGSRLGQSLPSGFTIDAHAGQAVKSTSGMETAVLDANGGISGPAARCVIVVSPLGDAQSDIDARFAMAHEVFHCFEGAVIGSSRYASNNPAPWIMEGGASWAGASIVPDAPLATQDWWDYLYRPDLSLFARTYSGIGFFGHLEGAGIDPWKRMVPILSATSNEDAFKAALADGDPFLDTWASSLLDDPARGVPWSLTGPAKPPVGKSKPTEIHLGNGGSVEMSAGRYANEIAVFAEAPEVMVATFTGRARLSDGSGHDYLGDGGAYCFLPTGCVCPGSAGEPPPLPLEGARAAIGLTGGVGGAAGTLVGQTLKDHCNRGLTGTWDGAWQNAEQWGGASGNFTLQVVQKGASFSGTVDVTGPTCIRHGKVTGTVAKDGRIQMGWVAAGVRDVNFEGQLSGRSMAGTWTAIACKPLDIAIDGSWSASKRK